MKTIWKYPIRPGRQVITTKSGAELLTVQTQFNEPFLWAIVDPDHGDEQRTIEVFGTGHPMEEVDAGRIHIATFQLEGGALVFHAFERL